MPEKKKAGIYLEHLDRILAGEKDVGSADNKEIEELLQLAKTMLNADLSKDSKIKERLKKQMFSKIEKNDELDDEDLDFVSAAFTGKTGGQKGGCPYCGSGSKKRKGKCPNCGI
ncbi:MAG: hypothetical protein FH758_00285 [Firmicutes bacterium]|nr:hypothetical protein [Bacillota bacterium]